MMIVRQISLLKKHIHKWQRDCYRIGFVPTMGALHDGHISLVRQARRETDKVVVSIFVNPTQFGPKEDYNRYPRPFKKDTQLCRKAGVDLVFYPDAGEIYPTDFKTWVDMDSLPGVMCGRARPGHFRGVMTVVTKLFNLVEPDIAYFGLKDYQQALIIQQMVRDLNMNVVVKLLPTVREPDGLAMSSRNRYLSPAERQDALCLYKSLLKARELVRHRKSSAKKVRSAMRRIIQERKSARIDYIAIADRQTLQEVKRIKPGKTLIAVAVLINKTRLIDNMLI